uniref:SEC7 domain-containing protein n=1 Tax=Ditylenchus dipsaci TaxID=166011 RepID=A0A915DUN0_9BILA
MKQQPYSAWRIVKRFGYTYFVVSVFGNHVGGFIYCEGNSMLPTLKHGDFIFAERLSVAKQNLCRGDLACSINPLISKGLICKRLAFKELDLIRNDGYNAARIPLQSAHKMMVNGVCVVQGEANAVVALLKKFRRNVSHLPALDDHDPLLRNFADLRDVLNSITDISEMNYNAPVTSRALAAVDKFINYGLISSNSIRVASAVQSIADSVTKAKFVGTADSGSDECVLFQILQTLRSLLLSPCGRCLTDETVCEVLQCCFRIGLEGSLPELLRMAAESALVDITRLLFTRLPTFGQDTRHPYIRKLVMKSRTDNAKKRKKSYKEASLHRQDPSRHLKPQETSLGESDTESAPFITESSTQQHKLELDEGDMPDGENSSTENGDTDGCVSKSSHAETVPSAEPSDPVDPSNVPQFPVKQPEHSETQQKPLSQESSLGPESVSVRTPPDDSLEPNKEVSNAAEHGIPYGLPCARELLRFLIALSNPLDRSNNNSMILMGLNLLTIALEAGADYLGNYPLLLPLVKNELCRALLQLLNNDKLPIFTAANRVCFLLFESLRTHLKFQLESYFLKLNSIITNEQPKIPYELKEMALENLVILWRIPGLVTELYLNYDCGLNLFEDLTRLLLQNAFPLGALRSTHILSLDALLTVIDTIDHNCATRQNMALNSIPIQSHLSRDDAESIQSKEDICLSDLPSQCNQIRPNRMPVSNDMPTMFEVIDRKKQKTLVTEATDLFNSTPSKAIAFLTEKGILKNNPVDPKDVALWLRQNPRLDKNKIAEYICNRKNPEVLKAFVQCFQFDNTRIDEALRRFLESFRLPGESAEISKIMQHFSEHWHKSNNEPFEHVDAAFTLCYAIIMLNVDQHNPQVRRNQPPMTFEGFKRNLSGTHNGKDFDPDMLEKIYYAIKNEEIVMPSEHVGLVKENYTWKVLLKRGDTEEGVFLHAPSTDEAILSKALNGYRKCAAIAAYYGMTNVFDNLIIHLCKFSTLMTSSDDTSNQLAENAEHENQSKNHNLYSPEMMTITFAEDKKAQMAAKTMFHLVHTHGDNLREGWKNVLDCVLHLFRAHLLPPKLIEVEDYVDHRGFVSIQRKYKKKALPSKQETSIFSWLGFAGSSADSSQRRPSMEQEQLVKLAKSVVADCHPEQLITDCKYLTSSALVELINNIVHVSHNISTDQPNSSEYMAEYDHQHGMHASSEKLSVQKEDGIIFLLELMISIVLENKDRLMQTWPIVRRHLHYLLSRFGRNPMIAERAVVGLLRVANRNLFRLNDDKEIAEEILQSLGLLLQLRPPALYLFSKQIADGRSSCLSRREMLRRAYPSNIERTVQSDVENPTLASQRKVHACEHDRGYLSDDPIERRRLENPLLSVTDRASSILSMESNEWIHVHSDHPASTTSGNQSTKHDSSATFHQQTPRSRVFDRGTIVLAPAISRHDPAAFLKVSETLAFLARDVAHITPANFESCINCVRKMVEASLDGGKNAIGLTPPIHPDKSRTVSSCSSNPGSGAPTGQETVVSEQERLANYYEEVSLQLLTISNTLYNKALSIHKDWALAEGLYEGTGDYEISILWNKCWRPLLQAMARLSCDCRRKVRTHSLDCLGTAFQVIFPLLTKLLTNISPMDPIGMEEIRVRVVQLVSKIFLYHLMTLSELNTFPEIISRILNFMEEYLKTGCSDLLAEAIPESLKNMILVLDNSGIFNSNPELHQLISKRLALFLPELVTEIMSNPPTMTKAVPESEKAIPLADLLKNPTAAGNVQIVRPLEPFLPMTSTSTPSSPQTASAQENVQSPPAAVEIPELMAVVVDKR